MANERSQAQQKENHVPASAEKIAAQEKIASRSSYSSPQGLSVFGAASPDDIPITRSNILMLQRTVGNRAVVQLLQRKAKISQPGDAYEQEADRVAQQVMSMPEPSQPDPLADQKSGFDIRHSGPTPEGEMHRQVMDEEEKRKRPEEEETIQAKEGAGEASEITGRVETQINNVRSGGGEPLSETVRAEFEPRFGQDFSQVRVHKDSQAADSAGALNARAYTTGRDVVFGAGEYAPETPEGKHLLAHELTHVVQQNFTSIKKKEIQTSSIGTIASSNHENNSSLPDSRLVQRQESPGSTTPTTDSNATPALTLIIEDSVETSQPGQMTKSQFLAVVRDEVCRSVGEVLARAGRSTDDCPYLGLLFNFFGRREAQYINRTLFRFAPEASIITSARDFIPIITTRVRQSAEVWVRTGQITGLPEGVPTSLVGSALSGQLSGIGNIFLKPRDGGARKTDDPQAIQAGLGPGRPLDSSVNSRMGSVFEQDFSHVRLHTDATAARLSNEVNARALTVGEHVAFGSGEYRPGTLIGDALIAHELAHVAQQKGGNASDEIMQKSENDNNSLEMDADTSAVNAVVALWSGTKNKILNVGVNALPSLKSGLRLQRCGTSFSTPLQTAIAELDSGSFDEDAVLEVFRNASQSEIMTAVEALKLRPHLEHVNYYRYLLSLMNRDLSEEEWREFEGMVSDVAITGEAPLQLSENARQLLTFIEMQFGTPNISQLLQRMRGANTADLDAALTTLRRRYNREHGHDLHRLSSVVRDNATEDEYRQFVSLLHQSGITLALRETDPRVGVLVEQETQLIREGAQSSLTDEEITGLFGTRALEIAYTMLRNSEQQLLQVMTRSSGAGAAASQFDADIEQARQAYGRITRRVPNFESFDDFAARVRARAQATGQTVSEDALRQFYDRERQIKMYQIAAPEQARLVRTIQRNQSDIDDLRERLSRPTTYIGQHPFGGGPAGEWSRRQQAIEMRQRWANELRQLEGQNARLTQQRQQLETALPLLGGLDASGLQSLAALRGGSTEFDQLLGQALSQVFRNIEKSRDYLQSGDVKIWLLRPVIEATRRQLGIPDAPTNDAQRRWDRAINEQIRRAVADERKVRETLQAINAGLLIVALGTALFSGGGSLALYATLTGTAVGVGSAVYGAIDATIETRERAATHGSGLTAETRLSDVPPDYEFLFYAWLGVGLEIGLAVFMMRSLARSGALSQLRGDAAAVRQRVQDIARRLRGRGATVSEQQLTDSAMTALEQRGWVGATGGVRGAANYELTGNTGPLRLADNVDPLMGSARAEGAQLRKPATTPSGPPTRLQYELSVPMRDASKPNVRVAVEMESVPHADLAAAGHGAEAGPARLILERSDTAGWRARIQVAQEARRQDVQFLVGHELDEAARIVRRNPRATAAMIAAQQQASLFRRGGSQVVADHDLSAADELRNLEREMQPFLTRAERFKGNPLPADLAKEISWRQARLARVMDSMALDEATNMGTKLRVLRDAGVSDELLQGIRARWQQGSYFASPGYRALEASSPHLRAAGSIMENERLVGHVLVPGPPRGGFASNGLHGGHHTESLLEWANRNPGNPYVVVEEANRSAARTTFRRYSQYQWRGTGPKPVAGDPRFPQPAGGGTPVAGTHYDSTLWQLSSEPKTTADSIQIFMREADDAWVRWRTTNPGLATTRRDFSGLSGGNVQYRGFYDFDPANGTWTIRTVYIEASWIP